MTKLQKEAHDEIWEVWKQRYGDGLTDDRKDFLRQAIIEFDRRGDMKKPVILATTGELYLVPIKDIILYGLKGEDLGTKYKPENGK
jgi:hypothetical protein